MSEAKPRNFKDPGRWRRRIIYSCTSLIILGFLLRAILPLALPAVMRKVAGVFDMTCTYERLELNLFSGDAGIWGLEFKPKEGGAPILSTDYCGGNVSVLNLFRGKLNVWRVEADGVEVNIDRNADGHIPLLDRFVSATAANKTAATPAAAPSSSSTSPVDLASPLRIDALRLSHIHVHIHDRGVTPEIDSELAMDLRLSDLGSPVNPAKFEMNLSADPFLDTMRITGEGKSGGKNLDAKLHILVRGIRPKPAAPYLAPLGIRPVSDGITLTADGQVHTAGAPNGAEGFTGSITFDHLSASADLQESLALDHLAIDAGTIDTKSIRINSFILDGARATAGRAADGNLQVAGIESDPALAAHAPPPPTGPAQPMSPLLIELMAERWSIGEVGLRNARLDLHDQGITPPVNLAFVVDDLSAKSIDHDPKNLNTSVTLNGLLHAPGLIREIKLDGTATPFADQKHFSATVNSTGIKPDAIKPYLDQIGVESTLKDAKFSAAIDASLSITDVLMAGANVTKFDYQDDGSLLSLTSVKVSNATVNPKTGKIGIGDIELVGPGISVLRDPAGQLSALGFRTRPIAPHPAQAIPVATTVPVAAPRTAPTFAVLPAININHFAWKGIQLHLEDQTQTPPTKISISDVGVEATNLSTDLATQSEGHFKAWLVSPEIAKRLEVDGNVKPSSNQIGLDATVNGSGLDSTPFASYLKPFGIEPVLRDGGITLHASANVTETDAGISASLGLDHLQYTAGSDELAAIDDLHVDGVSLKQGVLGINAIEITRPHAAARRDADGTLVAGGVRVLPPAPPDPNVIAPPTPPAITPTTQPAAPFVMMLKKLSVVDSSIDWSDSAIKPSVITSAGASVELDHLTIGRDAEPAILNLSAHAQGSADKLIVTGKVAAGPSRQSATLAVSASGLRLGPLAPYLPRGIGSSLKDGQFHTTIDAALSPNPAGGIGAQLVVGPLYFRDGADDPSLFQLDSVRVLVPRIDLPENALAIDELSVNGVQTHAEKLPTGELACMGLLLGEKTNAATPTTAPRAFPVVAIAPPPPPTTGPSVKDLLASAHKSLPLITLEKLDLNVSRLTVTDLSRPLSSPLVVSDLRLHNINRIDWLGKDAAAKPPTKLQFTCAISPLVDHVQVDAAIAPFARTPTVQVDFAASGMHGNGLTNLVPELKDHLDGTAMTNGILSAHFEAEAKLDRQSPIDFDVSNGFDLSFDLTKVQHRASPDGPVLAGVDEVRSDDIRIVPAESIVHVKTLEVDKPIGLLTQDAQGIHAIGWVYKLPTTQRATPVTQPVAVATSDTPPKEPAAPVKPTGEIRIDKLLVSGLDFRVQDSSVDPPLIIPLNGLDVEVRNISSLSPYEDKPIRFSAIVNADKVKLRKKGTTTQELEDRDLFSQITANGEVSLYPKLHGWAKTSVSGLDLASLEGPAKAFGETLTAGLYDSSVDLRFDPTGAIAVNSKFTLTDLSLSEPPNGLIYRTLHLPAPLDVVIGAVEGADGSIALPINVAVNPSQISYSDLGLAAAGGISQVIVTALAAAPLKAVNDVGGFIGFGGTDKPAQELTTKIVFSRGASAFGVDQSTALAPLIQKLRDDSDLAVTIRHQLGAGDLQLVSVRANPSKEQSNYLLQQLRTRKVELLNLRSDTAGKARAQLVSLGSVGAQPTMQQLRDIDRELADTEESLDQMGDLLRPGADKLSDRRTRTAALQIGKDRLEAVKSALLSAGIFGERVKIVTAQFNLATQLDGGQIVISAVKKK